MWEADIKTIPIDANFDAAVKQMQEEGYMVMPGVQPVAIFHVVRPVQGAEAMTGMGAELKMTFDEDKIFVIGPDGKRKS